MPADTLYEDDIVTWSEQQARAIRELVRTRPELSNAIDWDNVVEEIETLGRNEWKGVASKIRVALAHIIKAVCDRESMSVRAWSHETLQALSDARDDFRPSMRQHLDLQAIWAKAFQQAAYSLRPYNVTIPPAIPKTCPFTLDEILSENFDPDQAVIVLHEHTTGLHNSQRN